MHAQHQALEHGVKVTGATVHLVDRELDAGPIVLQAAVPVLDDDTEETLAARILAEEHRIYPEAIQRVLDGGWRIEGRRSSSDEHAAAEAVDVVCSPQAGFVRAQATRPRSDCRRRQSEPRIVMALEP